MWHSAARDPIRRKRFLVYTFLATFGCLTTSISVFAQASDQVVASSTGNQTPYHLKVTSNLVVVRVVVRDAQNKPIESLQKEDFKLFDRGKPQSITQFAVEMHLPNPPARPWPSHQDIHPSHSRRPQPCRNASWPSISTT